MKILAMRSALCGLALLASPVPARADDPSTRSFYLQLIGQARMDGRPRAALAYLDDFDRKYPGDVEARILRINSLLDLGEVDRAEAAAAALPSGGGASVQAVRGHLLAARNRWAEAIPCYQAAVRGSPADPLLRNALGYAQLRSGYFWQAAETLRGAADLAPTESVVRNNLLLALTMSGHQAEARAALAEMPDSKARARLAVQISDEAARLGALASKTQGKESLK